MSEVKVIGIGNDHAAVDLKNEIKAYLEEKGYKVVEQILPKAATIQSMEQK